MPKKPALILGFIVLLYAVARLWRLTESCLWFDEMFGVHAAEHTWAGMIEFVAKDLIHPPLFYVLLKLWVALGGDGLLWLRLFPVLFSILALAPLWMLCRELKLRPLATTIVFGLFAVNGSLIKYAQEVRMYSLLLFLSVVSIWLFSRFFFRGKSFWMLVLANILLVYSHYFGWFVIASEVVAIAIAQRIKILEILLMVGVVAVAFSGWLLAIFRFAEPGGTVTQNIGWMRVPGIVSVAELAFDIADPFYFQQSSIDSAANLFIAVPIMAIFAVAFAFYLVNFGNEESKERLLFLGVLMAVPLILAFALSWILPVSIWGSRHLLIVFPPALLLAAIFLSGVKPRLLGGGLVTAVAALTVGAFVQQVRTEHRPQIWCSWEKMANNLPADEPQTVYAFEDFSAYQLWFATRKRENVRIFKVDGMPGAKEDRAFFLPRGFDGVTRTGPGEIEGDRVWLAFRDKKWDERHSPMADILVRGYKTAQRSEFAGQGEIGFLVELIK